MSANVPNTKIIAILTRLNIGGPAIQVTLLNRELNELGYNATLVIGRCESDEADMRHLLQSGDRVTFLPRMARSVSPLRDLAALWSLYRLIRRERPDIVHTHTAKAGALGRLAAFLARVPVIVHTFHGNSLRGYFSAPSSLVARFVERSFARITDRICVLCPQQIEELAHSLAVAPPGKFSITPLGLDLAPYLRLPEPPPGPWLTVGWLGRFAPVKDVPLLASVVDETLRRSINIRFLVAGDGPGRHHIEQAAARSGGRLSWLGWQTDVIPLLTRCHILIQTSRNEGTPVALIQGMAAARPFVSTRAGGVVDMVEGPVTRNTAHSTWYANGVLANATPSAFAEALCDLAAHPAVVGGMGRKARNFAAARYSKERLLRELDPLYRQLLQGKANVVLTQPCSNGVNAAPGPLLATPHSPLSKAPKRHSQHINY